MVCARCSTPLVRGSCPKCRGRDEAASRHPLAAIPYELSSPAKSPQEPAEWRQEILRKLDRHKQRGRESAGESGTAEEGARRPVDPKSFPVEKPAPDQGAGSAPSSSAFHYQMAGRSAAGGEGALASRPRRRTRSLEKPVIRPLIKPGSPPAPPDKRQGRLKLSRPRVQKRREPRSQARSTQTAVFPEILFSRMLCGLIDVVAALLLGGGTVVVASLTLETGPAPRILLRDTLLGAGAFFVFSSVFLLYLSGQTLGMLATELSLISDEEKPPCLSDIVLRVLSFLAVTASLAGLVWALFDRRQLCWHDHVSRTRLVPVHPERRPGPS